MDAVRALRGLLEDLARRWAEAPERAGQRDVLPAQSELWRAINGRGR